MASNEGASALLHLSAAVAVLTTAFAGLDHTYEGRGLLEDDLKTARRTAMDMRNRLADSGRDAIDVTGWFKWGQIRRTLGLIFPSRVICVIAQEKVPRLPVLLQWIHCIYRLWHIPLLNYFQSGIHSVAVLGM